MKKNRQKRTGQTQRIDEPGDFRVFTDQEIDEAAERQAKDPREQRQASDISAEDRTLEVTAVARAYHAMYEFMGAHPAWAKANEEDDVFTTLKVDEDGVVYLICADSHGVNVVTQSQNDAREQNHVWFPPSLIDALGIACAKAKSIEAEREKKLREEKS